MGGDANVVPATVVFMLIRMISTDVVDLGFRSLAGPEHGRRVGRQQFGYFTVRVADIAEDTGATDAGVDT